MITRFRIGLLVGFVSVTSPVLLFAMMFTGAMFGDMDQPAKSWLGLIPLWTLVFGLSLVCFLITRRLTSDQTPSVSQETEA